MKKNNSVVPYMILMIVIGYLILRYNSSILNPGFFLNLTNFVGATAIIVGAGYFYLTLTSGGRSMKVKYFDPYLKPHGSDRYFWQKDDTAGGSDTGTDTGEGFHITKQEMPYVIVAVVFVVIVLLYSVKKEPYLDYAKDNEAVQQLMHGIVSGSDSEMAEGGKNLLGRLLIQLRGMISILLIVFALAAVGYVILRARWSAERQGKKNKGGGSEDDYWHS